MLISTWENVSLLISTRDWTFFPFNLVGKMGEGLGAIEEEVGMNLDGVESTVSKDLPSLGSSTILEERGLHGEAGTYEHHILQKRERRR